MSAYFIDGRKTIKTILTENITLKGDLAFEESLELNGSFSGTIRSKGLLVIGKTAKIKGNIYSKDLIIEGQVLGDVLVYNRLSVEAEAEVIGNITTHKIKVTSNATIEGECATIKAEEISILFEKATPDQFFRKNYQNMKNSSVNHNLSHSILSNESPSSQKTTSLDKKYLEKTNLKKKK